MSRKPIGLADTVQGRLIIKYMTGEYEGRSVKWYCICRCGRSAQISARSLVAGQRSCGKCGDTKHPLYNIYRGMIDRCSNPKSESYKNYGGRGIEVCLRWRQDFLNFVEDVGERPSQEYSIDRIDNEGNYEPGNTRWAVSYIQHGNRRPTKRILSDKDIVSIYNSTGPAQAVALHYGVTLKTVYNIRSNTYSAKAARLILQSVLNPP